MDYPQPTNPSTEISPSIHWGHFGIILGAMVLLLAMSWMENPALFNFKKNQNIVADAAGVPHYYPYVAPPGDQPQPEVLGASTDQGPEIIGDDGTVQPVDMGQVLGASTQGVQLSTAAIQVNQVPDSTSSIESYFTASQAIENNSISNTDFAAALNSNDQTQINAQADKLTAVVNALQKLSVPAGLVQLQKLQIIQYNSAIQMLQNFTQANQDPDATGNDLEQFLKSQQDLDTENIAMAQKYGALDPESLLYLNPDGTPAASADQISNFGSAGLTASADDGSGDLTGLDNSDSSDAGQ